MPEIKTRSDSLRFYLSGASSDGGIQTNPDQSCGKYRSSTEWQPIGFNVSGGASNLTVEYVSGNNALGNGTVSIETSDSIAWQPNGGTKGSTVSISNGETKLLESGDGLNEFVRVVRTSATALSGNKTVTISEIDNNVVGMDNITESERTSGHNEARCIVIKNETNFNITNLKGILGTLGTQQIGISGLGISGSGIISTSGSFTDWPSTGYVLIKNGTSIREVVYYSERTNDTLTVPTNGRALLETSSSAGVAGDTLDAHTGYALAKEAPTGDNSTGYFTDKTGDQGKPSGFTWYVDIDVDDNPVSIGTLNSGYIYGLWLWRETPIGVQISESNLNIIYLNFDAYGG